jgi:hypothetical protein
MSASNDVPRDEERGRSIADYWPLLSLVIIAMLAAAALAAPGSAGLREWMHYFMGFFLCAFAMFKIFDPAGFADGFEMYDLVASRTRAYAYLYPFLELGLGLAYLGFFRPVWTYAATAGLMLVGSIGVVRALRKGLDIDCPCMGSVLSVPLSTVTLTENIGMGLMAASMLWMTVV